MRRSGTWQTIWDDRILELIRKDGHGSPSDLIEYDEIRVSRQHVSRRLQTLAEHGFLKPLANGVYLISDEGEAYLDGEYDAEKEAYVPESESGEQGIQQ